MIAISGYQFRELIHESRNSSIYRARRRADNQPVILKILKDSYPSPQKVALFKNEYEILASLDLREVIKAYDLLKNQQRWVMVLEDFGGQSLTQLAVAGQLTLANFLILAVRITEIIGQIHQQHIIHKDLNPSNILALPFDPKTEFMNSKIQWPLKIIDFGISTRLSRENPTFHEVNLLQGTLTYISPEQTGRMNRALDYRTDFYSLGVTFYEFLTGQLPFESSDPLELVHSHIAKRPLPPHQLNSNIPPVVSDIILKLLAKNAEDRYQSASGLKADLEECLRQWQFLERIEPFPLGRQGQYDRLQIPQKLYGRERPLELLLSVFEQVSRGARALMLISGPMGVGKSALAQELYKPITGRRGYFISGKFDQVQSDTPYAPLIPAFRALIQQLLTESETQIAVWQKKLLAALGANGQVMIDVIPEIELIIGPQPESPVLGAVEAQNRFNLMFQKLITIFARPEHPLVIFLDNLQWIDQASLQLIKRWLTSTDNGYLFLIGAYRDEALTGPHPLFLSFDELATAGVFVSHLSLSSLELPQIIPLVTDTFNCSPDQAASLAELILEKTGGIPFFIEEFLKSLYAEALIHFDHWRGVWQWDPAQIKTREITNNVVRLMVDKMQKLSPETQEILTLAACIGHQFDLETLAIVSQKSAQDVAVALWTAVAEGMVLLLNRRYQFSELGDEDVITADYKFAHDQIRQAIYASIPAVDKQALHWRAGQLLLRHLLPDKRVERIFDLASQLNLGRAICVERAEWDELAELNLLAGRKAKAAAAYQSAASYLAIGLELINYIQSPLIKSSGAPESWERQYDLTRQLYLEAMEVAYLNTNFELMEQYAEIILQNVTNLLDKIEVYEIMILAAIAQNRLPEVLPVAVPVLKLLAIRFPLEPGPADVELAFEEIKVALGGRQVDELISLPVMVDPYRLAAMRLLSLVASIAHFAMPALLPILVFKMVALSLRHGNAPESAHAYATYGLILCGHIGDIDTGYKYGQLALRLLEQFNTKAKARTVSTVHTFVTHWKEPIGDSLSPLFEAYQHALETGDLEYAARSSSTHSLHAYFAGKPLKEVEQEMASQSEFIHQLKQERIFKLNELYRLTIAHLTTLDRTASPDLPLSPDEIGDLDQAYDPEELHDRSIAFTLYFNKLILSYLFHDYRQAVEMADLAKPYLDSVAATFSVPVFHFYDSLARLALLLENSEQDPAVQTELLQSVIANQQKLKKWADHSPANLMHKYYLVEAGYSRINGQEGAAREYYDQAIALAQQSQFINEEALANELAASFYLGRDQIDVAHLYLQKAHYAYLQWGAAHKVKALEKDYPWLSIKTLSPQVEGRTTQHLSSTAETTAMGLSSLDLRSALKASQIISSEIVLESLLSKMMEIVIENAGAQKGYLLLEKNNVWSIEASGSIRQGDLLAHHSLSLTTATQAPAPVLPGAIINYVIRTYQPVVLDDAAHKGQFTNDPYIVAGQSKSVMCLPLLTQGKLIGILYLENELTTNAFTPGRLELLNLLSAQAAISIENARFYAYQIELTRAYSRFVPREILHFLNKDSIIDVKLGDQTQQDMTVLFSDIRSFTSLSEQMTPQENFNFINAYLSHVSPIIRQYNGFIDKYMGDAIMALFPKKPDNALEAAIAMQQAVTRYNIERVASSYQPIKIGIGLHTGRVMLGTIGEAARMEGTVISDAVNLAARLEGLSKVYGGSIIISGEMMFSLDNPAQYTFRFLDKVKVKGKAEAVSIFEILDGYPAEVMALKLRTQTNFERGLLHYHSQEFVQAQEQFQKALAINPDDQAVQLYLRRIEHFITYGVPVDWEGIEALQDK